MSLLEQIKKEREEREKKKPMSHSIFYKLAYILEKENIKSEEKDFYNKINIQIKNKNFKQKEKEKIYFFPPFYLAKQETYKIVKNLEANLNPYMEYANSYEEILASIELWKINRNIDKNLLENYHLSNLLACEIAKIDLEKKIKEKRKIQTELEEIVNKKYELASKELSKFYDLKKYAKTKDQFLKFLDEWLEMARKDYIKERINEDLNIRIDKIETKKTNEKIKKEIIKNIEKNVNVENLIKALKIKERDLLVSRLMGYESLDKLIDLKLKKYFEELNKDIYGEVEKDLEIHKNIIGKNIKVYPYRGEVYYYGGTISNVPAGTKGNIRGVEISVRLIKKELSWWVSPREIEATKIEIGEKVKIYPGNGVNYDYGGSIKDVPAGSEGIINVIKIFTLLKVGDKAKEWWVIPKEIKLTNPLMIFLEEKGIEEKVAIALIKKDYDKIVNLVNDVYVKIKSKEMEKIDSDINYIKSLIIY